MVAGRRLNNRLLCCAQFHLIAMTLCIFLQLPFTSSAFALPAPDASCTVSAYNRVAPLERDYSFTIFNLPGPVTVVTPEGPLSLLFPPFRARVACSDGTVGETELAFPEPGQNVVYTGDIFWRPQTPVPVGLMLQSADSRLRAGQPVQMTTTGIYESGATLDLTPRLKGTLYATSNPQLATQTQDGLVSQSANLVPTSSARLLVAAQNEGVTATKVLALGPHGRLQGTVRSVDGVPVVGARVSVLRNEPRETVAILQSDALGEWAVEDVGAGSFIVQVADAATGDAGRASGKFFADGETKRIDVTLNGVATVNVQVQDAAGSAAAAVVTLNSLTPYSYSQVRTAAAGGGVSFARVPAGEYSVVARDPATGRLGAANGRVPAGGAATLTVRLQSVGSIGGRVLAADGTAPVAGVQVRLVSSLRGIVSQAVTGTDGQFLFDWVPTEGNYGLDAMYNGRVRARVNGLLLSADGQQLNQYLTLGAVGLVTGIVRRADGALAADALVRVQSQAAGGATYETRAAGNGTYKIDGVPVGDFIISAFGTGNESAQLAGAIAADGSRVQMNIQMASSGLVGTVYARDGVTPVAGAEVSLSPGGLQTTTNANGRYGFTITQPAQYTIMAADSAGNKGRTSVALTVVDPANPVNADIAFLGRGGVEGRVTDVAGVGQAGVEVTLVSGSVFGGQQKVATDANGFYQFPDVFVGTYDVSAINTANLSGAADGRLVLDGETAVTNIVLAASGTVTGRVFRLDGVTPVPSAAISLNVSGRQLPDIKADLNGNFSAVVPLGDVNLVAKDLATGDRGRGYARISAAGEARSLDIGMVGVGSVVVRAVGTNGSPVVGATVKLQSQGVFAETYQGTTNDKGYVSFARVNSGAFAVTATLGTVLYGSATGSMADGDQLELPLTMEPTVGTGSVRGIVTLGGSPVAGAEVWIFADAPTLQKQVTGADGRFHFDGVLSGRPYRLQARVADRIRAVILGVTISEQGQVIDRDLPLLGAGTVRGRTLDQEGNLLRGVAVELVSQDPLYLGTYQGKSDSNGQFVFTDIPVVPHTLKASAAGGLRTQVTVQLQTHGEEKVVDLTLIPSSVSLPRSILDANGMNYHVDTGGQLRSGLNQVFVGNGVTDAGAANLELVVGGVPVPFQSDLGVLGIEGVDGQQIEVSGFHEASGLTVTRRTLVPADGYFARHLDILENASLAPVQVGVRLTTNISAGTGGGRVIASADGDQLLAAGEPWVVVDDTVDSSDGGPTSSIPPVAMVFSTVGAAQAPDLLGTTLAGTTTKVTAEWSSVLIPPGSRVSLMYFTSQQVDRLGAISSAERIAQIPPEALLALDPSDRATVINMVLPQDGAGTVSPLPSVRDTRISGRVLSGDRQTGVGGAKVTLRSQVPQYARRLQATTNAAGEFVFESSGLGSSSPVGIPAGPYRVRAEYVPTDVTTALTEGEFDAGQVVDEQDLVFEGTGTLRGQVRRHTGALVTSGKVRTEPYPVVADIIAGAYVMPAMPAGVYALTATQDHPQGGRIVGNISAQVGAASLVVQDVTMEETGAVAGRVFRANGEPAVDVSVQGGGRSTSTDTAGTFTLNDVRTGAQTLTASDTDTNETAEASVTVVRDVTTAVDLQFAATKTVTVQVNYARGVGAPNARVQWSGLGATTTDALGRTSAIVVGGQPLQITASHPDNLALQTAMTVMPDTMSPEEFTLVLPAAGTLRGTVFRPDGVTPAQGLWVDLRKSGEAVARKVKSAPGSGTYLLAGVEPGTYVVSVEDVATAKYAEGTVTITADGQDLTTNLRLADNMITLPAQLQDANSFRYTTQTAGGLETGVSSTGNPLLPAATLTVNGIAFTGASAANLGANGRQLTVAPAALLDGLKVSRRVYVPRGGYFARYLEIFENPGSDPVTVTASLQDTLVSGATLKTTSSGDAGLDAANDDWFIVDDYTDSDPFRNYTAPTVARVIGQAGAIQRAQSLTQPTSSAVRAEWNGLTVPAGGRVALMHFVVQQVDRDAATYAAERLEQLPPEALQDLPAEDLAAIVNFTMPANGVSALDALPSLSGVVEGRVTEGDGVTAVSGAHLKLRSRHPLFGRELITGGGGCNNPAPLATVKTSATGNYTITGRTTNTDSVPLPVGWTVDVQINDTSCGVGSVVGHPVTGMDSPVVEAVFADGNSTARGDISFESGIVTGRVLSGSGYPVSSGSVSTYIGSGKGTVSRTLGAAAVFTLPGVPEGSYRLNATVTHNQGTSLIGSIDVEVVAGQTLVADIALEAVGSVTGSVITPTGTPVTGQTVRISGYANGRTVTRTTTTDSLGNYLLTAVPVGSYTLSTTVAETGFDVRTTVAVAEDQQITHNFALPVSGKVQLVVKYPRGTAASFASVVLSSAALPEGERTIGSTSSTGALSIGVPAGAYTLKVAYPGKSYISPTAYSGTITSNLETQNVTLTLPAVANVGVTVVNGDTGNAPISGLTLRYSDRYRTDAVVSSKTNTSGRSLVSSLVEGPYSVTTVTSTGKRVTLIGTITAADDGLTLERVLTVSAQNDLLGVLAFGEEQRLYSVPVTAGDRISLSVTGAQAGTTPASYAVAAAVYDTTDAAVARGYGYGPDNNYQQYNTQGGLQDVPVTAAGHYTVAVSPYYPYDDYAGGFRLGISVNGAPVATQGYQAGGAVQGTVYRPDGTTAIADQLVEIETTGEPILRTRTVSDASGRFVFVGVPVGPFVVKLLDSATAEPTQSVSGVLEVAGQTVTADLLAPATTTLDVTVTIPGDQPLPSEMILMLEDDSGVREIGPVIFDGSSRRSSVVSVQATGTVLRVTATHPDNANISVTRAVTGLDGQVVPVDIELVAAGLEGYVRAADGSILQDAILTVVDRESGDYLMTTFPDTTGYYLFDALPAGRPLLVLVEQYGRAVTDEFIVTLVAGQTQQQDLQMTDGVAAVQGVVRRTTGQPVVGAIVVMEYVSAVTGRNYSREIETDADGAYAFAGVPSGMAIAMTATKTSMSGNTTSASSVLAPIAAGSTATVDFALETIGASAIVSVAAADGTAPDDDCEFQLEILGEGTAYALVQPCSVPANFSELPPGVASARAYSAIYGWLGAVDLSIPGVGETQGTILTSKIAGAVRHPDGAPAYAPVISVQGLAPALPGVPPPRFTAWSGYGKDNGEYVVYGLAVGSYVIEGQDGISGLRASSQEIQLSSPASIRTQDLVLPSSGTVRGVVVGASGQPVANAEVYVRSSGLNLDRLAIAGENGHFEVARVALGEISVIARDPVTRLISFGAGALASPNQVINVTLAPPQTGAVSGVAVEAETGVPVSGAQVTATTLGTTGVFGPQSYFTTADTSGHYQFAAIPVGGIRLQAVSGSLRGSAEVTVVLDDTAQAEVRMGAEVSFPYVLSGTDTGRYDISCTGALTDGGFAGVRDSYDTAYQLSVGGNQYPCVSSAPVSLSGREVNFPQQTVLSGALTLSRSVYVPAAGGFARYLDSIRNNSNETITVPVQIMANLGSDSATQIMVSPNTNGNRYAVTRDGGSDPTLAHVFGGIGGAAATDLQFIAARDDIRYGWTLSVPPGETRSILHFAVQRARGDVPNTMMAATLLESGAQSGMFDGLSSQERASIVNFVVSP